jgi:hypothetical protein
MLERSSGSPTRSYVCLDWLNPDPEDISSRVNILFRIDARIEVYAIGNMIAD